MPEQAAWVVAAGAALVLHAFWLFISPRADFQVEGDARLTPPQVYYLPLGPAPDDPAFRQDVRAVWSPILFSVPTAMGFSEALLRERPRLLPPIVARDSAGVVMTAPKDGGPPPAISSAGRFLGDYLWPRGWADRYHGGRGEDEVAATWPTGAMVRVFLQGQPEKPLAELQAAPGTPWADEQGWEAVVCLSGDPGTVVRHALLELPTASAERNREIVRIARTLDMGTASTSNGAHVVFRWVPAVRAPANDAGGSKP